MEGYRTSETQGNEHPIADRALGPRCRHHRQKRPSPISAIASLSWATIRLSLRAAMIAPPPSFPARSDPLPVFHRPCLALLFVLCPTVHAAVDFAREVPKTPCSR